MKDAKKGGEPAVVRAVLLVRHAEPPHGSLFLFGRGLWASSRRVEVKFWARGTLVSIERVPTALRTRSRVIELRDPLLAQEWAYARWDEYLGEVLASIDG